MTWDGRKRSSGWINIATVSGFVGTAQYKVRDDGDVQVRIDGSLTTISGTVATIANAGAVPAPSLQCRAGAYFSGFPGTVTIGTDGSITALQQSGADRGSVSVTMPPYATGA